MALVTFVNDSQPYLSAENLNNNFEYLDDKIPDVKTSTSSSTTDTYSCAYMNNNFKGTILYDNSSGTNGNITLSESASNYAYLIVFWQSTYNHTRMGVSLAPNANRWSLFTYDIDPNGYSTLYFNAAGYYIGGTSFDLVNAHDYNGNNNNTFYIRKIVGIK